MVRREAMSDAMCEGLGMQPERRHLGKRGAPSGAPVVRAVGEMGPCGLCGNRRPPAQATSYYTVAAGAEASRGRRRLLARSGQLNGRRRRARIDAHPPKNETYTAYWSARLATQADTDQNDRRNTPPYFFSGSGFPCGAGCVNGNELNIVFAWFCICSCICTNMFFDCSI